MSAIECRESGALCDERPAKLYAPMGVWVSVHPSQVVGPACQAWPGYHRPAWWVNMHIRRPGHQIDHGRAVSTPHACIEGEDDREAFETGPLR